MLRELGMCESKEEVGFTFLWSRPWEKIEAFFRPKKITPGSIVNSVAGLPQQVGQKTSLARLHVACMARAGYDPLDVIPKRGPFCRFTSRAFAVRKMGSKLQLPYRRFREYNVQLNEEEPEEHRIWILKPQGGFNQVGIHMYSLATADIASDSATAAWLMQRVPEGTWVLQEYLMNPMTYQGHKFDLRVWASPLPSRRRRPCPPLPHPAARLALERASPRAPVSERLACGAGARHVARPSPRLPPRHRHPEGVAVELLKGGRGRQGAVHPRPDARHQRVLPKQARQCPHAVPHAHKHARLVRQGSPPAHAAGSPPCAPPAHARPGAPLGHPERQGLLDAAGARGDPLAAPIFILAPFVTSKEWSQKGREIGACAAS